MITVAMSIVIGAKRERVWRALTSPQERIRWDDRILALQEPAGDYPCVGQSVHWRYEQGSVPVTLIERPLEVLAPEHFIAAIDLGLFAFEVSYGLQEESEERTRLQVKLGASNSVPVVGGHLDRFEVRRVSAEFVDATLRSLQKWCENAP